MASFGVNGAGLLLMLAVFASTGGLTGIEVGIAGGTSVLSQKVLEAIFGDQAVRTLTAMARDDLRARVKGLLDEEAARFTELLEGVSVSADTAPALLAAERAVRDHQNELPGGEQPEATSPEPPPTPEAGSPEPPRTEAGSPEPPPRTAPAEPPPRTAPAESPPRTAPAESPPRTAPVESPPGTAPAEPPPRGAPADDVSGVREGE
ncbi:hypothetical protein [Nonomuraea dietziae]|uniref:hypothetical protein n=1 Tax=Nonomuraea dietziae TaxID=65515 RepID=UPI0033EC487B